MKSLIDPSSRVTHFPELAAALDGMLTVLERAEYDADTVFIDVERALVERIRAVGREAIRALLCRWHPSSDEVRVDGARYRRMRQTTRGRYTCLDGTIEVERHLYREVGVRNGATVVPLELAAGMTAGMTPMAVEAFGQLAQALPTREAAAVADAACILDVSRSGWQRGIGRIGHELEAARFSVAEACIDAFEIADEATSVCVSVDRVAVPVAEPRRRPSGRPKKGAPKRPLDVVWRMAYCACLTLHDASGEVVGTMRHGEMPTAEASALLEDRLRSDLHELLHQRPDLDVVTIADGAAEMQHHLDRVTDGLDVAARLVDFWHAVEYLGAAASVMNRDLDCDKQRLLTRDRAAQRIAVELRTWLLGRENPPTAVTDALRYFENQGERMHYAAARSAGLPIGSGNVEATCKTLVAVRFKRAGARWTLPGGQAVMHMRSLAASGLWSTAARHLADLQRQRIEVPMAA